MVLPQPSEEMMGEASDFRREVAGNRGRAEESEGLEHRRPRLCEEAPARLAVDAWVWQAARVTKLEDELRSTQGLLLMSLTKRTRSSAKDWLQKHNGWGATIN